MNRRLRTLAPPVVLILLVVAIAGAVHTYASPPGGLQLPVLEKEGGDARVRTGKPQYPREAIDGDEVTVRVARPAHRVVSQYWSLDEFAYSILPAEDVVAVSESAYLEEISNVLANVKRFNPAVATDPERVVALDPDLMLVSTSGRADYTSLARSSGIPVYRMQTMFDTLDQIEQNIRLVGYMTGQDESAAERGSAFSCGNRESCFLASAKCGQTTHPWPWRYLQLRQEDSVSRHCDQIGWYQRRCGERAFRL